MIITVAILAGLLSWMDAGDVMAQECPNPPQGSAAETIDYSSHVGPIKDQDGIGWCYAYSSADLLNQYVHYLRRPHRTIDENFSISPISISTLYNDRQQRIGSNDEDPYACDPTPIEVNSSGNDDEDDAPVATGGIACRALNMALSHPICFETRMRSGDYSHVEGVPCDTSGDDDCNLLEFVNQLAGQTGSFNCQDQAVAQQLLPLLPVETIWEIFRRSNRANVLQNLRNTACRTRLMRRGQRRPTVRSISIDFEELNYDESKRRFRLENHNARLFARLNATLNSGRVATVSYFPDFLDEQNPGHARDASADTEGGGVNGTHASTIVGRRWNADKCEFEYKLKNSWGTGCARYTNIATVEVDRTYCRAEVNATEFREPREGEAPMDPRCRDPLPADDLDYMECLNFRISLEDKRRMRQECNERFQPEMINKNITCEEPGYLYIPRSELAKHMFSVQDMVYRVPGSN